MIHKIIINGAGGSGKDTFIDLFTEVVREHSSCTFDSLVRRYSSVDEVKSFAELMGWDGVKDERGRRFLSDIKDAMTRYNDAPFNYMIKRVAEYSAENDEGFIFFHVREPKEIQKAVDGFGATTLFVDRKSVKPLFFDNHADRNVTEYSYDYRLNNDGSLEDLKEEARKFYHFLISHRGE